MNYIYSAILLVFLVGCGGDEIVTEIENNDNSETQTPRERAEDRAQQYNIERRNDEANFRCHVCRKVNDECGEAFEGVDPPPCEWEAIFEEPIPGRSGVWGTQCVVIQSCVEDTFVCSGRCP